jgi:tripartite ATP-independent transporter DctM subunit
VSALFGSFMVLLAAGMPIAFLLGLCCLIYIVFFSTFPLVVLAQRMVAGMNTFTFLAVPLFVLAGNLMNATGITDRLVVFVNGFVGHIRGGLAIANVQASMLFAGVSGTAVGDTASVGGVLIPAMKREGYKADYAAAITAASSIIGPIIPPSLPMIIVATLLNLSVGRMFVAGIIPGILLGVGLMLAAYIIAVRDNHPHQARVPWGPRLRSSVDAVWAILMPLIILGGIVGGVFTPTEAAAVACVYGILIGVVVMRTLKVSALPRLVLDSLIMSVPIMILVGTSTVFSWILVAERVPQAVAAFLFGITENPFAIILIINLFLLFVGVFMETIAAMLILFPVLFTIVPEIGVDPIQFAVMMVLNLMIGLTTPPVGVCLFVAGSIARVSIFQIVGAIWPFYIVLLVVLLIVAYVPPVTLFLPGLFYH